MPNVDVPVICDMSVTSYRDLSTCQFDIVYAGAKKRGTLGRQLSSSRKVSAIILPGLTQCQKSCGTKRRHKGLHVQYPEYVRDLGGGLGRGLGTETRSLTAMADQAGEG